MRIVYFNHDSVGTYVLHVKQHIHFWKKKRLLGLVVHENCQSVWVVHRYNEVANLWSK